MKLNPLYFMIPATVTSSFAFMLPVAAPPNAIVFAAGKMTPKEMVSYLLHTSSMLLLSSKLLYAIGQGGLHGEHYLRDSDLFIDGHVGQLHVPTRPIPRMGRYGTRQVDC